ncbi:unnamed protein product [Echinostoma caproni]|uniref:Axin_b-cat_bind domain-containing protein n=1 Tax=Echinostoma caproni TaxID=27848 RepID=A0A183B489_9TREM|nr:unnamed protein product [Echinostoma caproni]
MSLQHYYYLFQASPNAGHSASEPVSLDLQSATGSLDVPQSDHLTSTVTDSRITSTTTTVSAAFVTTTTTTDAVRSQTAITASALLQRPWADRLLAAARSQQDNTRDNAQAILEDHCSRIWAASADRTPNSSSSSGGGVGGGAGGADGGGGGGGGVESIADSGDGAPFGRDSNEFTQLAQQKHAEMGSFDIPLRGTVCPPRLSESASTDRRTGPTPETLSHFGTDGMRPLSVQETGGRVLNSLE